MQPIDHGGALIRARLLGGTGHVARHMSVLARRKTARIELIAVDERLDRLLELVLPIFRKDARKRLNRRPRKPGKTRMTERK